jgi:hypothetical protein
LSGNGKTRLECAKAERKFIDSIVGENEHWFAVGDRNFITDEKIKEDADNCLAAQKVLEKKAYAFHKCEAKSGLTDNTWIGYEYDEYALWKNGKESVLDYCVASLIPYVYCAHPGVIKIGKLLLDSNDTDYKFGDTITASDHAAVFASFQL